MEFEAKVQEKRKGGKNYGDYRQQFLLIPTNEEFEKGDKVNVVVTSRLQGSGNK